MAASFSNSSSLTLTMKNTPTKITGQTPKGNGFTLTPYRLEWHAHGDVGSIGVPLKADAPLHEIG